MHHNSVYSLHMLKFTVWNSQSGNWDDTVLRETVVYRNITFGYITNHIWVSACLSESCFLIKPASIHLFSNKNTKQFSIWADTCLSYWGLGLEMSIMNSGCTVSRAQWSLMLSFGFVRIRLHAFPSAVLVMNFIFTHSTRFHSPRKRGCAKRGMFKMQLQ